MSTGTVAWIARHRTLRRGTVAVAVFALMATALPMASAYQRPGRTEVISLFNGGLAGGRGVGSPVVSDDGRRVAFWSYTAFDPNDNLSPPGTDLYVRDRLTDVTTWVSQGSDGEPYRHASFTDPALNADGRYVVFATTAPMVAQDTNGTTDVFLKDLDSGAIEMISNLDPGPIVEPVSNPDISSDGRYVVYAQPATPEPGSHILLRDRERETTEVVSLTNAGIRMPGISYESSVSANGRYVAFSHQAVPAGPWEVYVRDRTAGTTQRVSVGSGGRPAVGLPVPFSTWAWSGSPVISGDGRYVAFISPATDLVPRDTNLAPDVFVHDRETGTTERVSVSSTGTEAEPALGPCSGINPQTPPASTYFMSMSSDGRYVTLNSLSGNLVPGPSNLCHNIYVHDRMLRITERVSVAGDGSQGERMATGRPSVSAGGRSVAFQHLSRLAPEDTNSSTDTYLRDRGPAVGVGGVEANAIGDSVEASGWATFSGGLVSDASDQEGDAGGAGGPVGADLTSASLLYRHEAEDLLARLSVASMPARAGAGATITYGLRFTIGTVTYEARIDDDGATLHRCMPGCSQTATLEGSIGTTGNEALIAIPLNQVGAAAGAEVGAAAAFTQLGLAGQDLDDVDLPIGTVPEASVQLGLAPAGAAEPDVEFSVDAVLSDGAFSGSLDASSLPPGNYDLWARACLGAECGSDRGAVPPG